MPKLGAKKTTSKGMTTIRMEPEEKLFYQRRAQQHGMSLSDYLKHLQVKGLTAEQVEEMQAPISQLLERLSSAGGNEKSENMPETVLLSIFTIEEMLTSIVTARDVQALYEAQNKAKIKLGKMRS